MTETGETPRKITSEQATNVINAVKDVNDGPAPEGVQDGVGEALSTTWDNLNQPPSIQEQINNIPVHKVEGGEPDPRLPEFSDPLAQVDAADQRADQERRERAARYISDKIGNQVTPESLDDAALADIEGQMDAENNSSQ